MKMVFSNERKVDLFRNNLKKFVWRRPKEASNPNTIVPTRKHTLETNIHLKNMIFAMKDLSKDSLCGRIIIEVIR